MYRGALGSMGLEWETIFLTKHHVAAIRKHGQIATVVGGIQDLLHYLDIFPLPADFFPLPYEIMAKSLLYPLGHGPTWSSYCQTTSPWKAYSG